MTEKPHGAGKSSFDLVDVKRLFTEIELQPGHVFLDIACGSGAYAEAAARIVESSGRIHAFDLWEAGIFELRAKEIANIDARVADVGRKIPLADQSVDIAVMAMVLHDLMRDQAEMGALDEIFRVLKPQGKLAVVEFKKKDGPPGPPLHIKLSPKAVVEHVSPFGFHMLKTVDLGEHSYLTLFRREG